MFGRRISLKQLAVVCRSLGTSLHAGVPILKAFDLAAGKTADPRLRAALSDVVLQLRQGEDVETAMRSQDRYFPDLMVDMISVAERTGALPEVLRSLSEHYENNLRLRKDFIGQITIPVIQLIVAVLVIAGLIYILGWIAASQGGEPLDVLGWGLTGTSGAVTWLSGWVIGVTGLYVAYRLAIASLEGRSLVHRVLMAVPVVGQCMRDFGIARFSWAFHLTQEAGMPIDESIEASLKATANGAFIAATPQMVDEIADGETLTDAFAHSGLFNSEFIEMVHVGENTGTVPEALHRLGPQFEDQARRSLRALSATFGWLVWVLVAGFIVFVIFSIVLW
ncbi:MAG: type II secretion system F family protein, partial [Maioricimonas sp. JB045]